MSDEKQPSTFYNVMPEVTGNKAPVSRKVNASKSETVFSSAETRGSSITMDSKSSVFKIFRNKFVWIPAVVILLAAIGAGVWFFLLNKKSEPIETPTVETPIAPVTDPDVTTPAEWLARYFGSETCTIKTTCADKSDPDHDGLANKEEFDTGTDPNNPDSDSDGVADGDEVHIFETDPLLSRTFRDGEYTDSDFVKGGYDIKTNIPYSPEQIIALKEKVKGFGLHQPTLTTIGPAAMELYDFTDPDADSLASLNLDMSPQAKLDRDSQRQTTIKKVGAALLKYKADKKAFPTSKDFVTMSDLIGSYNTVATNYNDPINKERYVYSYEVSPNGVDFTLAYYSETQNQLIKYTSKNAEDDAKKDEAAVNDQQRITDLESIKSALLIYSTANIDSNSQQTNVFPTNDQFPSALIPRYITDVPLDPNGMIYQYEVGQFFETFTIKAVLQNPPAGKKGYMCNEKECKYY